MNKLVTMSLELELILASNKVVMVYCNDEHFEPNLVGYPVGPNAIQDGHHY
jgi:hypothetical protein